ncbi:MULTISPECIES: MBL fold metallo-hydrolase [Thiorhodovibrio]|uniref:MBL fold metallo-hydrolase n=1 Tax=Thiorhodovibrio TaxID=61593 RepID=UPI00191284D9|nr:MULTISPECIES: MBL fold metallo-hydrolase [Thiorhodovibrio]MBK5968522.1 MBL fold metallo-hydrolase [Thiorhodovibrio winogradskyi]WPL13426.1 Thiosulfate sulfurtransferase GlpE [Thiorhodovibrio litoralis]
MFFKQFYLPSLGHASYLVGSEDTGEALVLDVRRDVETYFAAAREQGMRIRYACDSHQHNDYLSGICELPERGEVQLLAGARAEVGYPVRSMDDGERLDMGEVRFELMHTPGHTPEHISLLVTDRSRGEEPAMLFSGGALLVGDLARPDLLGGEDETRRGAEAFCQTLQHKILPLPDFVEVFPTHVAGSLCGGNIGSRLSTTIGYERRMNQLLSNLSSADDFVHQCMDLTDLPAVPPYWPRMRQLNSAGPPLLGVLADPPPLGVEEFEQARAQGATVLDCRAPEAFSAHIPRAINVGVGNSFATWAGSVLAPESELVLVLDRAEDLWEVCWQLLRIGYPLPRGWLAGGMLAWRTAGKSIEVLPQWTVRQLARALAQDKQLLVLDVRQPGEWSAGHIAGAHHLTGAELTVRAGELPKDRPVAAICGSGFRSSVAASVLKARGHREVYNVLGGMTGWEAEDLPMNARGNEAKEGRGTNDDPD